MVAMRAAAGAVELLGMSRLYKEVAMARTAMALVREKQLRALKMAQEDKTYEEIADELGYANGVRRGD